ncbi:hypothetical protein LGL08_00180 [Clostridium estertheticum]|uniref:hypothetical protein n=1 Tax=Clostridium estertheticum TaxID=238834 RepID=UPI001CF4C809|nr:hypothetical protein [Clostridium estertheticum]MCB2305631.1 hypothetical protein [Clostridium estertheticum]MCB2344553.1 hypothetical protein [Clostridium estertheticum]MCB2347987.1 hypothetical protein [Clostridium estertheticum]WAG45631.1 hypothetical protein LL127_19260 [Clostridium estertheticum]
MEKQFSTLGYGFVLEETVLMLDYAINCLELKKVQEYCIGKWPQKSIANKERLWRHLKYRFFQVVGNNIENTPFLKMYAKIRMNSIGTRDLIFHQLCITTPILFQTLLMLVTDSFLNTGEAVFSNYHLDQLMEQKFGRIPKSTKDRVRKILIDAKRLIKIDLDYHASAYCPTEAVLGYALYYDAEKNGWRAPSTNIVIEQGTVATIFLCNKPFLFAGLNRMVSMGHCEYHRLGQTDQVQFIYNSLEEFVNAWK